MEYDDSVTNLSPRNAKDDYRINCINIIVDNVTRSMHPRFEQLKSNHDLIGILVNFKTRTFFNNIRNCDINCKKLLAPQTFQELLEVNNSCR